MCLGAELRYATVSQEHKLLDKLVGLLLHLEIYTRRVSLLVEVELRLTTRECYCSLAESLLAECLSQSVECQNLIFEIALARLYYRLCLLVGEATVGVDYGATKPLLQYLTLLVDVENCRECELVLVWSQRA